MRDKIAKELFYEGLEEHYTIKQIDNMIGRVLTLIREEIEKSLLAKDEIERIWETGENEDPFVDFERVAQAQLGKILKALEV